MSRHTPILLFTVSLMCATPSLAQADVFRGCDDAPGLATVDGTVGSGEYTLGSEGVGSGFGELLGNGIDMLVDSDSSGNLAWSLVGPGTCTPLASPNSVVVYLDTLPGEGIDNTSQLTDTADPGRSAVSGTNGTDSADLGFAPGFRPDYAIVIEASGVNLFQLVAGGSLTFVRSLNVVVAAGGCTREMDGFSMADLGSQTGNPIRWVATLINSTTAFRANEFQGVVTAPATNPGTTAFDLAEGDFNAFRSNPQVAGFRGGDYYTDFETFEAEGVSATAACDQLNSNSWAIEGFSDGDVDFGESTTSNDLSRGVSSGGEGTGGLYAFEPTLNDPGVGVQASGSDFTPGSLTLRVLNATTSSISAVQVNVTMHVLNDQDQSTQIDISHSTNGTDFTPEPSQTLTTLEPRDSVGWVTSTMMFEVAEVIAPGGYLTLRWDADDAGSGGARDEFAIGAIHLEATYTLCGNGAMDAGEACDDGGANGATACGCQSDCQFAPVDTTCSAGDLGPCDAPDLCDGAGACTATLAAADTVCRAPVGACDVAEVCVGDVVDCPADTFLPADTECAAANGSACDVADVCNGTDGLCAPRVADAGVRCRDSAGACDLGATCNGTDDTCPSSAPAADTVVCRAAVAGGCDVPEMCTGSDLACPEDAFAIVGTVCNPAVPGDLCDRNDVCTGTSSVCVPVVAALGTSCRDSTSACDLGASCDGTTVVCPESSPAAASTECRASAGICDPAEVCDGTSLACPTDALEAGGTECRASVGPCDVAETCSGSDVGCPADVLASAGTECRAADGDCDVAEQCSGTDGSCPTDAFATAGTECRASGGACDPAEACSGSAGACPADTLATAGTECRASTGDCDPAEACDGTGLACPADMLSAAGTECRASAGACDAAEMCDGTAGACPADVDQPDGTACADGTACNGAEVCMSGSCGAGTEVDCDDGDICTADLCSEPDGACASTPIDNCCIDAMDCEDGDPLTIDECVENRCQVRMADGGVPDAGVDAGPGDAGFDSDASTDGGVPMGRDDGGCSCRAGGTSEAPRYGWGLVGLIALALMRRRRLGARG
ncbi:MAG: MYXO-CTERM sorting domain-containing protein [Sandaracinaceae bacterium]